METKVLITTGELAGQEGWLSNLEPNLELGQWEGFLPQVGRLARVPPASLRPVQLAASWPEEDYQRYPSSRL